MDRSLLTPLFVQYYQLKDEHPGALMLMRVGDFFEAYGEDAETLARDAGIVQTAKEAGAGQRLAMAGVPHFSVDSYLRALIEKGHRVAIADQMEAAAPGKGLVRREVTRVVTAGTVLDPQMLDEQSHNYLLCLVSDGEEVGLAACDVTTGDFVCTELPNQESRLAEEIYRFRPSEVVLAGEGTPAVGDLLNLARADGVAVCERRFGLSLQQSEALLKRQFKLGSLHACDLVGRRAATLAAAALLSYLLETTRHDQQSLEPPRGYSLADTMILDTTSLRNLEVTETLMGRERRGSLLWAVDHTVTAMGARLLRQWLTRPLLDPARIARRQDSIQALVDDYYACQQTRQALHPVKDIERLLARVVYQSANARDLVALLRSLSVLPQLHKTLPGAGNWPELAHHLQVDADLMNLLGRGLADDPPQTLREGGLIRTGFHSGLDELREACSSAKNWIAALEERERELTGIRSLKVGFNQVFGYYLEVTRSQQKLVPEHYIRKQTLANAERYFTPELKEIETKVLGAEDKIRDLEYDLFLQLRAEVATRLESLRRAARAVAETDVYAALAEAAVRNRWVRPEIVDGDLLDIRGGRHPVVERSLDGAFVPNDCVLDEKKRLVVLTGPNMSGKSTYLRQTALIVLLAQTGAYVPAEYVRLSIHDRVFTRVGAADDLHLGQSTFMVEMSEAANILRSASRRSLVILDEIGRGTSTYDGLALARAIAEYLHQHCQCKTLFATHFHELTSLARDYSGVVNQRVAVQESREEVVFLHKIVAGGADRSYGIYVGQLAGLPGPVLERAQKLLLQLERESRSAGSRGDAGKQQLSLFFDPKELIADLQRLPVKTMTPQQVKDWVEDWKARL
jgi:DNA mismatch repair protein MutS